MHDKEFSDDLFDGIRSYAPDFEQLALRYGAQVVDRVLERFYARFRFAVQHTLKRADRTSAQPVWGFQYARLLSPRQLV
jgi:hypothetical protein